MSVRWQGMLGQVAIEVSVLEADGTPVSKNRGRRGEIVVGPTGFAGGAYYLQVTPITNIAVLRPEPYRLEVERIAATPDTEPNDDETDAQWLATLPAQIRGMSRGAGTIPADPDVFKFELPRAMAANEVLVARASVVYSVDPITVTIRDGFFSEIGTATDIDPQVEVVPPNNTAAAIYYVDFRASLARSGELSVYDATVGIETRP